MRLFEFDFSNINSGDFTPIPFDPNGELTNKRVEHYVEIHCSDAVTAFRAAGQPLFRGIKEGTSPELANKNLFIGKPFSNRRPKASYQNMYIDQRLLDQGFTAIRSESIMCTGDWPNANIFGKNFTIFPLNGFSFTWSPRIRDLNSDKIRTQIDQLQAKKVSSQEFCDIMEFKNTDLVAAIKSGHEIYIKGPYVAYYSIMARRVLDELHINYKW